MAHHKRRTYLLSHCHICSCEPRGTREPIRSHFLVIDSPIRHYGYTFVLGGDYTLVIGNYPRVIGPCVPFWSWFEFCIVVSSLVPSWTRDVFKFRFRHQLSFSPRTTLVSSSPPSCSLLLLICAFDPGDSCPFCWYLSWFITSQAIYSPQHNTTALSIPRISFLIFIVLAISVISFTHITSNEASSSLVTLVVFYYITVFPSISL